MVSLVVFAVEPVNEPIQVALAMVSDDVAHVQLWRLMTWPFANLYVNVWVAVSIFFFWYFGTEIERAIGRVRMAVLFFGTAILTGIVGCLIDLSLVGTFNGGGLAGLSNLGLLMALVFIAEYSHIRFFFGIPGWVVGVVLVGIQIIQPSATASWSTSTPSWCSLVIVAVMARSVGLLTEGAWIPRSPCPRCAVAGAGGRLSDPPARPSYRVRGSPRRHRRSPATRPSSMRCWTRSARRDGLPDRPRARAAARAARPAPPSLNPLGGRVAAAGA